MRPSGARRGAVTVVTAAFLVALLLVPASVHAEKTIGLSAGVVDFTLAAGQSAGDFVMVANNGDEPVKVLLYTADIVADEEGNQKYERPAPPAATTPATWVRLQAPDNTKVFANTPYLEMEPGQEFRIDYTVAVPGSTPSGDHNAVIFFEMFEFADDVEQTMSLVSGRLGARLAIRVVGEIRDRINLESLTSRTLVIGEQMPYGVRVDNSGSNVDKVYDLDLVLVASGENQVWTDELERDGRVYAARERDYSGVATLSGVGFGRYSLRAVLGSTKESGTETITAEPLELEIEREIWVVPLWMAIGLILLISIPLLWIVWRTSKRPRGSGDGESGRQRRSLRNGRSAEAERRRLERERRRAEADSSRDRTIPPTHTEETPLTATEVAKPADWADDVLEPEDGS